MLQVDLYLEEPGGGEEFVYAPVGVSATLHCAVMNTRLIWEVAGLRLDVEDERDILNERNIIRSDPVSSSANNITTSSVSVFGTLSFRNGTIRICCKSRVELEFTESCTTLIIYGIALHI